MSDYVAGCIRYQERVNTAAIRLDDGSLFSVARPGRHHDVIRLIHSLKGDAAMPDVSGHRQGFITNSGRFVSRQLAFRIANEAGQILRATAPDHGLFSEDVW